MLQRPGQSKTHISSVDDVPVIFTGSLCFRAFEFIGAFEPGPGVFSGAFEPGPRVFSGAFEPGPGVFSGAFE